MQTRALGKTGLLVSAVGFGGIPIRKSRTEDAVRLIEAALDAGITFFDTAQGYGDSEVKIGQVAAHKRDAFILATKSPCRTAAQAEAHVNAALRRLQTEVIDLYQVHNVTKRHELEEVLAPAGALEGLIRLKERGKIRHVGITGHDRSLLKEALSRADAFETVQFPFNIVEDGPEERSLLQAAQQSGVGTIIMKPLAGGVIPEAALSLRWILHQGVNTVIPGMIRHEEVADNARVGDNPEPLSRAELAQLKQSVRHLEAAFCRRCMYCMPCPQGIHIALIQELGDKVTVQVEQIQSFCREKYAEQEHTVEDCADCGECEEKCPYDLPVRAMLREKHRRLT